MAARVPENSVNREELSAAPARRYGERRLLLMKRVLDELIGKELARQSAPRLYLSALRVLETCPMPLELYLSAVRRLNQSLGYASQEEHHAAVRELKALSKRVSRLTHLTNRTSR